MIQMHTGSKSLGLMQSRLKHWIGACFKTAKSFGIFKPGSNFYKFWV